MGGNDGTTARQDVPAMNAQVEGATAPVHMEHYYQGLGDGVWFK